MPSNLLQGDTAPITGAASGIGRGIAQMFAREGARVVLTDVSAEAGFEIAKALNDKGHQAHFIECDLSQKDAWKELLAATQKKLGTISLFVHSASPKRAEQDHAMNVSEEIWDAMLTVNVRSGFMLGRAIGQHMKDKNVRGRMLYITSLHADTPRNLPHYSASKAGETMIMKELARALGPHGISVNAIAPGAIPGGGFKADVSALIPMIAMRRMGTPDDIANMATALVSERFSAYVTGTTVVVDGGIALYNWIGAAS